MQIIGITGTLGAGKGAIVEYLEQRGFAHYSARNFITQEIERRKLPINRDTMTEVANSLRKKEDPSFIIKSLYEKAEEEGRDAVIESVRASGELDFLRTKPNFYLIAIDADSKIRFERIKGRGAKTDKISYEKFLSDEEREMNSADPTKQNVREVMEKADFLIENSTSLEDLEKRVDAILLKIKQGEK